MTKVLDHGHVILERHSGTDLDIVCAARQSFDQKSEWDDYSLQILKDKDAGLINYLVKNRHGSPFEHVFLSFSVRAPLFVSTQWIRHRAGHSFNFESGRYSELKPEFYVPAEFRTQVGKPGAYRFAALDEEVEYGGTGFLGDMVATVYGKAWQAYLELLGLGVAKEQARMVLPVATYTSFTWSVNARSLMHWLGLRNSEHSQFEIREYAKEAEAAFATVLPVTYQAFLDNERVSP